jgi:phosphonate metabolism protein PhnN/1,5-bisphosphokinase (PRPP-forming)
MAAGVLVMVVGPSGAGKDTVIDVARAERPPGPGLRYVCRAVTRPAGSPGEDHEPMTPEAFDRREAEGGFALAWRAHGHAYGVPADVLADLAAGRIVIVNGSREVLGAAMARFDRLVVVHVTAPPALRAMRLAGRGREVEAERRERMVRETMPFPDGAEIVNIINDTTPEAAGAQLVALIDRLGARVGADPVESQA